ncbi:hypothetical protein C8F01DRAFT_1126924 [Mycena amicta]|nr:hypothetical protein C8F01DRAFT_1126924 [Mycena amicta]
MPGTTQPLPSTQRANLMRSTRKLGAILGETPLVIEPPSPTSDYNPSLRATHGHSRVSSTDSRRSGRIFVDPLPRGPSLAAVPMPTPAHEPLQQHQRPQLFVLRRPNHHPLSTLTVASPISPGFPSHYRPRSPRSPPLTPLTPTAVVVDKRKKMAKLVRTLGTNVPHDMVFSKTDLLPSPHVVPSILTALAPAHGRPASLTMRRRESGDSLASATREAVATSYSHSRSFGSTNSSSSTKSGSRVISPFAPLHRTGTSSSDSSADSWVAISTSSAPASPSPAAQYIAGWNASADDIHVYGRQPTTPPAHVSTTSRSTNDARFLSRHIEFRGPSLDIERARTPIYEEESSSDSDDGRLKPSTYRKEERQGWSGEWTGVGAGGMDDVVARLRGMKTK